MFGLTNICLTRPGNRESSRFRSSVFPHIQADWFSFATVAVCAEIVFSPKE
jgi:hypothetical protein